MPTPSESPFSLVREDPVTHQSYSVQVSEKEFYLAKQMILQATLQGTPPEAAAELGTVVANLSYAGVDITTLPESTSVLDVFKLAAQKGVAPSLLVSDKASNLFTSDEFNTLLQTCANLTIAQLETLYALTMTGYTSTVDLATGKLTVPEQTADSLTADVAIWAMYRNMEWTSEKIAQATGLTVAAVNALIAQGQGITTAASSVSDDTITKDSIVQGLTDKLSQQSSASSSTANSLQIIIVVLVVVCVCGIIYFLFRRQRSAA
jgi:hypothetical protein